MKKGSPKKCKYCESSSSIVGNYHRKFFRICKVCRAVGLKIEGKWWWFRNISEASIVAGPCYLRQDIKEKNKERVI